MVAVFTIEDKTFNFSDIKQGINFCFALFFALDVKYPNPSSRFWVLFQQIVYGVYLSCDRKNKVSRNISLPKEIQQILAVGNNTSENVETFDVFDL